MGAAVLGAAGAGAGVLFPATASYAPLAISIPALIAVPGPGTILAAPLAKFHKALIGLPCCISCAASDALSPKPTPGTFLPAIPATVLAADPGVICGVSSANNLLSLALVSSIIGLIANASGCI